MLPTQRPARQPGTDLVRRRSHAGRLARGGRSRDVRGVHPGRPTGDRARRRPGEPVRRRLPRQRDRAGVPPRDPAPRVADRPPDGDPLGHPRLRAALRAIAGGHVAARDRRGPAHPAHPGRGGNPLHDPRPVAMRGSRSRRPPPLPGRAGGRPGDDRRLLRRGALRGGVVRPRGNRGRRHVHPRPAAARVRGASATASIPAAWTWARGPEAAPGHATPPRPPWNTMGRWW